MSTELFRKYIDIVEGREQVNEGMIDDVKAKFSEIWAKLKAMPGFAEAYQKAKTMEPELKQILQSSSSGKDAADKIKNLASGMADTQTNESNSSAVGAATGLHAASALIYAYEFMIGLADKVINIGANTGNWAPALFYVGIPVFTTLLALALLIAETRTPRLPGTIQK